MAGSLEAKKEESIWGKTDYRGRLFRVIRQRKRYLK